MRRLSKNKHLNDTLLFGSMLLFDATGGVLGEPLKGKEASVKVDLPFAEKLKLFAALQDSVLLTHKVDPKKENSGMEDLRDLMNDTGRGLNGSGKNKDPGGSPGDSDKSPGVPEGADEPDDITLQ